MADKAKKVSKELKEAEMIAEAAPISDTEKPVTAEENITEAAIDEAEQEGEVIAEKRTTAKVAKAGKRSTKALKEAEEKEAKESRKAAQSAESSTEDESKPKQVSKPSRSKLERSSKRFKKSSELVDKNKLYSLAEAVELALKTSSVKFDATVELHVNLAVDPRHADQNIRDNLVLPSGSGKSVRVAVLADVDDAAAAKKAGADIAGNENLLAQLEKGEINFDTLIATPAMMSKLGKYARTLGPRGLMPNPKSGTVTADVVKAVNEAKAGRVEYRVDSTGIVHLGVGKASFTKDQLRDNVQAVLTSIKSNKPASVKAAYFKAIHLTTTMGPSITVDLAAAN